MIKAKVAGVEGDFDELPTLKKLDFGISNNLPKPRCS